MATSDALPVFSRAGLRKPPVPAQYNWIRDSFDVAVEQLELPFPPQDDAILPEDGSVVLLATENGAQLLVSGFGLFVGKKGARVVVRKGKETCGQLPLLRLQEIVLSSKGISLSTDLLEELCGRGIRVAFLTSSGRPYALLTSPLLTATVETRRAQFAAYHDERGAEIARWVVAGKIRNQEKLLRYFAKNRDGEARRRLEEAAAALRKLRRQALKAEGHNVEAVRPLLMGLEGTAGRMYWREVVAMLPDCLGFEGRVHEAPADAVNAMLNYGYGILYAHVWGAVMNAGLEPFAGFLHSDRGGKPSLVLDLTEEFRQPVVDRAVFTWLTKGGKGRLVNGMLDGESKEAVAGRVMLRLQATETHRGKNHQVRSIIQMQARLAAAAVRGLRPYRPFTFKW
jgi:CRISPR-associated protein Cas1